MNIQVDKPVLEVHDLTVSYDKKPVLWDVDFTIPYGNLVGIIGPNGAGKSTLIKAIMNLVPKGSGFVKLYDDTLDNVRHKISYVPQRESVDWDFPASVLDVVLMGRYGKGSLLSRISKKDKEIAYESLKRVNMLDFANRQISQLSGGQQQRTFLARALAQEADLYLMDEPFAGVDAATERSIVDLLLEMRKEGKTIIVVHHDLQSAIDYFDWTLLLNTRLVASGPTEKVFTTELLQETYGGKLTLLSKIGDLMKEKQFPARENK
jgi:manganese/zinc/iron transport system ATP- binding protein|tara:strand:- start:213 stop:1004 length:792 start_codon:yes stop_codon:yes gene_type:complete